MKLKVIQADITTIQVDAIVNAANSSLMGGSGVDGAIHRKGGTQILDACRAIVAKQGKCKIGEAVLTTAGNLHSRYVIHTVGPVWNQGGKAKEEVLANCYKNSIQIAIAHGIKSLAFPNISTGIYKFPKEIAASIAIETVKNYMEIDEIEEIIFVCFDIENYNIYQKLIEKK